MKSEIAEKTELLRNYSGRKLRIMEICGSHTAAISKSGLRGLISEKIELVSGPGCPVCVTPSAYIDKLISLSFEKNTVVCVFGDMLRIPGSRENLSQAKGGGGSIKMLYSPLQLVDMAAEDPETVFIFGAVGFETTTPAYALLLEEISEKNLKNVKLLTSLKTMPEAVEFLCISQQNDTEKTEGGILNEKPENVKPDNSHEVRPEKESEASKQNNKSEFSKSLRIDAFLAPGHVCAVRGYQEYEPLAEKYGVNFGVAGFEPEELVEALWGLVKMCSALNRDDCTKNEAVLKENATESEYSVQRIGPDEYNRHAGRVKNFYPSAVTREGNKKAAALVEKYFEKCNATWRGLGNIPGSGLKLKEKYALYDAGSAGLDNDVKINSHCRCGEVLCGKIRPSGCPLFGKVCTPLNPQGACMVSEEGACRAFYETGHKP